VEDNGRSGFLFFVWAPNGYSIVEQSGEPPTPGTQVEDGNRRYRVTKVAPSPLPDDSRRCAYLQPA
jgi:hypothetical protein